jgi:hypothetical protein
VSHNILATNSQEQQPLTNLELFRELLATAGVRIRLISPEAMTDILLSTTAAAHADALERAALSPSTSPVSTGPLTTPLNSPDKAQANVHADASASANAKHAGHDAPEVPHVRHAWDLVHGADRK